MEVGTMQKTEYLALNPSVDPALVYEINIEDFIYQYQQGESGFMLKGNDGLFTYFMSIEEQDDAWSKSDIACIAHKWPDSTIAVFEDWNGKCIFLKGSDSAIMVGGPTVGYFGLDTYETAFQVVI
jgi:hypothetical protein